MSSKEFDHQVWEAEQVRCVRCHADPGVPCRNTFTGEALHGAHWQRVRDVDRPAPHLRPVRGAVRPDSEQ